MYVKINVLNERRKRMNKIEMTFVQTLFDLVETTLRALLRGSRHSGESPGVVDDFFLISCPTFYDYRKVSRFFEPMKFIKINLRKANLRTGKMDDVLSHPQAIVLSQSF